MKYAFITTNISDLWAEPKFNCERVSQLFFGDPIRIMSQRAGYFKAARVDNYTGWVDERFCRMIGAREYKEMVNSSSSVVISMRAALRNNTGRIEEPFFLFYGTRLRTRKLSKGESRIIIPSGLGLTIKTSQLRSITRTMSKDLTGRKIVTEARKFLGLPYLWGGISSVGVDCSGLVQTVFSVLGFNLPRDTKDQISCGMEVSRESVKSGDLLFFKRHVAIAIDNNRIIHSSVSGGGVRENSICQSMPGYREDLDLEYKTARRIL